MPFGEHQWILVVEDDIELRATLSMFLQSHQYPTISVSNGVEALRILTDKTKHLPCLIVMNLDMPIMDGSLLLRVIECCEKFMGIPICIATGSINIPESGRYKILHKPYSVEQLLEVVEQTGVEKMNHIPPPNI